MFKKILVAVALASSSMMLQANSLMQIKTTQGNIDIELYDDKAPISVQNFKNYAKANFYAGTIFHRVIPNFMIQGGGFSGQMVQKTTQAAIKNEANNGLKNVRGSLAMARTSNPDSATSQFFINLNDNVALDRSPFDAGYAVFGQVVKGMDVVDRISGVPTSNYGMHQNVPKQPVIIQSIQIISDSK
ncbi:peptidylprolyl isomerase [Acinetobacter larvae]|uniref:Peptidyl-prolyl cis-trans isomerase n=1 Tax=Acinetobacter larvae TaxID=1789224 RepID=A0A1B2M3Q1_9GAMM|nr:peptidylprolyl isomerase [Acinetobacter larvae]AOA59799.1 peptidylprolyl isomerase A [Acinetobacter larvae]